MQEYWLEKKQTRLRISLNNETYPKPAPWVEILHIIYNPATELTAFLILILTNFNSSGGQGLGAS